MNMEIEILCSSTDHPVNTWLKNWKEKKFAKDRVRLVHSKSDLSNGDILFLVSCTELIGSDIRSRFKNTAVIHASDLPEGAGATLFVVIGSRVYTPPVSAGILEGITRDTILKMPAYDGFRPSVREKELTLTDLYGADEAMLCGTSAEILEITNVDGYTMGRGGSAPGSIVGSVRRTYNAIVRGRLPETREWVMYI